MESILLRTGEDLAQPNRIICPVGGAVIGGNQQKRRLGTSSD